MLAPFNKWESTEIIRKYTTVSTVKVFSEWFGQESSRRSGGLVRWNKGEESVEWDRTNECFIATCPIHTAHCAVLWKTSNRL